MLIQFSIENFLSFKHKVTFSMVPSSIIVHEETHVFEHEEIKLLKSTVLYGSNAGGKSNLFAAMYRMKHNLMSNPKPLLVMRPMDSRKKLEAMHFSFL